MRDNLLIILFCFAYKDCRNIPKASKPQAGTWRHWKNWVKSIRVCQRATSRRCSDSHRSHGGGCAGWGAASPWAQHLPGLRQKVGRSFWALQGICCSWLLGRAGAGALAVLPGWTGTLSSASSLLLAGRCKQLLGWRVTMVLKASTHTHTHTEYFYSLI